MDFSLGNVTQAQFDAAENVVISLLKEQNPNLELKKGSVLRELLVKPNAQLYALNTDRTSYVADQLSLQQIALMVPPNWDMANRILSNYNITRRVGTKAYGQILVKVTYNQGYYLSTDNIFTVNSKQFTILAPVTVVDTTTTPIITQAEIPLRASDVGDYYYFVVNAQAVVEGTDSMIDARTTLDVQPDFYGYISAESYSDFVGGSDSETMEELIARLPAAISNRGLDSYLSISSFLRDNFVNITEVGVVGMGETEQLRDRHNVMGISMGGRVDVYPKTFVYPSTVIMEKTATRSEDYTNNWIFSILSADAPGFYMVKSITDLDSASSLGSYSYIESRGVDPAVQTVHDIASDNSVIETAYTIYQKSDVTVTDVPTSEAATRKFRVEVYVAPQLIDVQALVDSPTYKNRFSDYLVRSPLMCFISLRVVIHQKTNYPTIDVELVKKDIADYINGTGFGHIMTKAQVSAIVEKYPVIKITTDDRNEEGMVLQGKLRDAAGNLHTLQGDVLDINSLNAADYLVSSKTVLFVCDKKNLFITIVRG